MPRVRARTLYLPNRMIRRSGEAARPDRPAHEKGDRTAVLHLTPLVRAIVDHVRDTERVRHATAATHLLAVLRDQLPQQREVPLFVPALRSPLARRVAEALTSDPADTPRLRDLAAALAVSGRTLERVFAADALMPLGEWRQRWRICRAIALLTAGARVQDVALEVGYATPSAFIAIFKKYVGLTPHRITFRPSGR